MSLLAIKQSAAPDKGAALTKLKLDLDVALTNAREAGVSPVIIADELERREAIWRAQIPSPYVTAAATRIPAEPKRKQHRAAPTGVSTLGKLAGLISGR